MADDDSTPAPAFGASEARPATSGPQRTALYRHFDAQGRLLYVGISLSAFNRLSGHAHCSGWFARIASVTIEWYGSREDARLAERLAIFKENPKHNLQRPSVTDDEVAALSARVERSRVTIQVPPPPPRWPDDADRPRVLPRPPRQPRGQRAPRQKERRPPKRTLEEIIDAAIARRAAAKGGGAA
jgi:hypothetical protein